MRAEIVSIGTEITSGQALDTNSRWLAQELASLGIAAAFHTTISDELADHVSAFKIALDRTSLVITTGGLGPTQDDLTREAIGLVANVPLEEDAESWAAIVALFARRSRPMPERNRVQALLPRGATALANRVGTAPGVWMRMGGSTLVSLPGVPSEMKVMFHEQVIPRLREAGFARGATYSHKINLFGKGESDIEALALDLTARGRVPEVGITAHEATISFRITATGATEAEARLAAQPTIELIHARFGDLVIGEGDRDVPEALAMGLERANLSIATAESCTGGLISALLTTVPGVSRFFLGGVISYSNEVKSKFLSVPRGLIETHGAVSPEVAAAMAAGARDRFASDLAISSTGVAGPGGGSAEKPVGLVYLGLATRDGVQTRKLELGPEQPREVIQKRAAKHALNWARLAIGNE